MHLTDPDDRHGEPDERRRLGEELDGLDPHDPEVQEFADHLLRPHRSHPAFTVEGYLSGVSEFADSANRATGGLRLAAVLVVGLLLLGVVYAVWQAAAFTLGTLFG